MNSVILGDCLIESDKIESGSVDLILTDLPYGTVTNIANSENCKHGMKNNTSWDLAIEPSKVYEIANRILRKNGRMILFSQEPYSTQLISQAIPNLPFNFRMIWEKDHFANSLIAKKAPVSYYEDILVFSKKNPIHDCEFLHPLREYFQVIYDFIGKNKKQIIEQVGQGADHTFRFGSSQFALCTEKIYNKLIEVFNIDEMEGFKSYSEIKEIDEPFRNNLNNGINSLFPSTFNLWECKKYKPNILKYKKDYNGYHPTQKPILLLEDLIKTFSNENDLVVDLTAGSGSTAIACINTNRNYILIEKEQTYYNIINERIAKHKEQTDLFKDEIK